MLNIQYLHMQIRGQTEYTHTHLMESAQQLFSIYIVEQANNLVFDQRTEDVEKRPSNQHTRWQALKRSDWPSCSETGNTAQWLMSRTEWRQHYPTSAARDEMPTCQSPTSAITT